MSTTNGKSTIDLGVSLKNLKWFQTVAVLLSIAALVAALGYAGANHVFFNASINVSLEDRLTALENKVDIPLNSTVSAFVKEADYIVSVHEGYYCLFNGSDSHAGCLEYYSTNKTKTQQFAVGNLTSAGGGIIFLKNNLVAATLTYGSTIRIIESYQGALSQYRNNIQIDCPVVTNGTYTFTNGTSEQTLLTITPASVETIENVYFDFSALTQNFTIRCYSKIDGTNYVILPSMTLALNSTTGYGEVLKSLVIDTAFKITVQSGVAEGASRSIPYRYYVEAY